MRDTVSIIFAAIFMVLVIIILPLFSILDRQDNISYNVVLTQTTKFVDEIRTNGFITESAYAAYISSLASTGNTYKVTLEAYKHSLIPATDQYGNVIADSYVDELELYNTSDILAHLGGEKINVEAENSNKKENVYLFEKSDEIYVRVYNTNVTAGSIMYNMIVGAVDTKVIDITYGGAINNVNWEVYEKIKAETIATPEVTLSVPVNANNSINVNKIVTDDELKSITCIVEDYGGLFSDPHEMCSDIGVEDLYKYTYDIDLEENKTITVAARFTDVSQIRVREETTFEYVYGDEWGLAGILLDIFDLNSYESWDYIKNNNVLDSNNMSYKLIEKYIIDNYIRLNGMTADIDLTRVGVGEHHHFNIVLTNVKMATIGALTENASIAVLPGLGRNDYHELTVGDETVTLELIHKTDERTTEILGPYNWKQYLKVKTSSAAAIASEPRVVFRNQEIFFLIQYTGIKDLNPDQVKNTIKTGLSFNRDTGTNVSETASLAAVYYTPLEMKNLYGITLEADTILVKFTYKNTHELAGNRYLNLGVDWYPGMEQVRSEIFLLERDTYNPNQPTVQYQGELGDNGWYTTDVFVRIVNGDDVKQASGVSGRGGTYASGVYESRISLSGGQTLAETDASSGVTITESNIPTNPTKVNIKSVDYVGNTRTVAEQKIYVDKIPPSKPVITIAETAQGSGWYAGSAHVTIDVGTDAHSGIDRTTYTIEGSNAQVETTYTGEIVLDKGGISTLIARHYDKAGNSVAEIKEIKIDTGEPAVVTFEDVKGLKKTEETEWYHTEVTTRVTVHYTGSATQVKPSKYEVIRSDGTALVSKTDFSESVMDVTVTENDIYTINVYTKTAAGVEDVYSHVVKIDGDAPEVPKLTISSEDDVPKNENGWYTTDVKIKVELQGDIGPAGATKFKYTASVNGGTEVEYTDKESGYEIPVTDEGTTLIRITTADEAGNEATYEEQIKLDKSAPTPATLVVDSVLGSNNWYVAATMFSHVDSADDVSGILKVDIATYTGSDEAGWTLKNEGVWEIADSTSGTKVILTTHNGAGLTSTYEQIIKIDIEEPTPEPVITVTEDSGGKLINENGVYMTNVGVTVNITPSNEVITGQESGIDGTYYTVKMGGSTYIEQTKGTSFTLPSVANADTYYSIEVITKDNAGNYRQSSTVIRILTIPAEPPEIARINGISVSGGEVQGTDGNLTINFSNAKGTAINVYVNSSKVAVLEPDEEGAFAAAYIAQGLSVGQSVTVYATLLDYFGEETAASNVVTYTCIAEGG